RARAGACAEAMKLTLRDLEVRGKRVLVRVDFNVPVEARDGKIVITDDTRIRASLPTINWLREHGAKTILMSHFGRPKGKRVDKFVQKLAMGLLMEKELHYLHEELDHPGKPFVVIMGGAKVSDKIGVLKALMEKADTILICGAMANTFFKAQGIPIGASRVEADKVDLANALLTLAKKRDVKLVLPVDAVIAQEVRAGAASRESGRLTPDHGIPDGWQNL